MNTNIKYEIDYSINIILMCSKNEKSTLQPFAGIHLESELKQ